MIEKIALHHKNDKSGLFVAIPLCARTGEPMNRFVCVRHVLDVDMLEYDDFFDIEESDKKMIGSKFADYILINPIRPKLRIVK